MKARFSPCPTLNPNRSNRRNPPLLPENAPESAEKKEESALYYTKWQQRMMKKGYVVTPKGEKAREAERH